MFKKEMREVLYEKYSGRCFYCNKKLTRSGFCKKDDFCIDHMTPLKRGGKDDIKNCVPACHSCNTKKGDKTLKEYLTFLSENGELSLVLAGRVGGMTTLKRHGKKHFKQMGKKSGTNTLKTKAK